MQSRFRILVIDDDPMYRNLIVSLLRKDYIISVACDGESGFAKAKQHRPDLVIIDYQMPGWDGVQTLKAFRNDPQFKSVKTVMLTSDASKNTVLAAIQAGTDNYTIKTSFNKDDFLLKIQQLLAPVIARPVSVKATAKPFDPNQTPAISITGSNKETICPTTSSQSLTATLEVEPDTQVSAEAKDNLSHPAMTTEEQDLEKEMLEFQQSIAQKAEPQLISEPTESIEESFEKTDAPLQGFQSNEALLEEVLDDWE